MKQAKILGLRIQCPRQLPVRHIAREDYAIGPLKGPRRYYVVRCDCGDVHYIRMKKTDLVKPGPQRKEAKRK